jgi:hypothetical protein
MRVLNVFGLAAALTIGSFAAAAAQQSSHPESSVLRFPVPELGGSGGPIPSGPIEGWRLSLTGSVSWGGLAILDCCTYVTNQKRGWTLGLDTFVLSRGNTTGQILPIAPLGDSHTVTAVLVNRWGRALSSVTLYCVDLTPPYDASGLPLPATEVHSLSHGIEQWTFTASASPPSNGRC